MAKIVARNSIGVHCYTTASFDSRMKAPPKSGDPIHHQLAERAAFEASRWRIHSERERVACCAFCRTGKVGFEDEIKPWPDDGHLDGRQTKTRGGCDVGHIPVDEG
jgi:hypothetical protein